LKSRTTRNLAPESQQCSESATAPSKGTTPHFKMDHYFKSLRDVVRFGSFGARVDCFPAHAASPNGRRVGIRIVTFEACSGFTNVTACRIALPPKAAFVTSLQPCRLPGRAARQLPDHNQQLISGWNLPPLVIRAFGRTANKRYRGLGGTCAHSLTPRDRVDRFDPNLSSLTPRSNPHSARCPVAAPNPAISCLGASRTPAPEHVDGFRIPASEKPAHERTFASELPKPNVTSLAE
jgi:hypothetical protein